MKKKIVIMILLFFSIIGFCSESARASEMDILVNKLVEKGVLTPYEGQILMAQAKEEAAKELAEGKAITAPEWTQKIKIKGDVRFRTQTDWGKGLGPAHERIRERVRARLGVEGKVNEQVSAGILAVTGNDDPRSTNQTLDDNFETYDFRLDQYYIHWTPELTEGVGTGDLWLGKFKNPLVKSELLWDGDICPGGIAAQYMSPNFNFGEVPTNLYANGAMLWLDEIGTSQRDPLMWVIQGGLKMDIIKDWDASLNLGTAYYGLANVQGNQSYGYNYSAGTNTLWGGALGNTYRYDFHMLDLIFNYDSKKLFDFEIGHGLYGDFIWNTGAPKNQVAWQLGCYLGTKKPKKPGDWKLWGEYRYIERDAVPDFMPDSDFYGFTPQGRPRAGGTGGQGINCGIDYAIFKNTVLSAEYYWMEPISINTGLTNDYDEPYQLLQLDIKTKF